MVEERQRENGKVAKQTNWDLNSASVRNSGIAKGI